jgi:flagellar motor switch protein FliN/FliY
MADESSNDPQSRPDDGASDVAARASAAEGSAPEGSPKAVGAPEGEGPSAAVDAERALKAAQDAIRGLEAHASAPDARGPDAAEGGESAQSAGDTESAGAAGGGSAPESGVAGAAGGDGTGIAEGRPVDLPRFDARAGEGAARGLDLLSDVNLNVRIELGRTRMLVEDVLRLGEGAVVELDKLAGDPVDVFVNGRPVARGEVLVLNDNFCIRISEILDEAKERVQREAAR